MRRRDLAGLPDLVVPSPYVVRTADRADADALAALLTRAFGVEWTAEKAIGELIGHPEVRSVTLIEQGSALAATASAKDLVDQPETGYVHWVGTDPDYAGNKLGYWASLAVLHQFATSGKRDAVLHTDDFRVPAVKTYLRLGFRPEIIDADQVGRWERLRDDVGLDIGEF